MNGDLVAELGGLEKTAKVAGISNSSTDLSGSVASILNFVLSFVGVIFLILLIYGGFLWMTSTGNQESITKARNIVISAIIGLVIVLSAYTITRYIGTTFSA